MRRGSSLGECRDRVVVAFLGDREAGAIEPSLAQRRVERQRLVEVFPAQVELAADAARRRAQEERPGVLRLALEDRRQEVEGALAVAAVHRLLRGGERVGERTGE